VEQGGQKLTKKDDPNIWSTLATFSLLDLQLSVDLVADPFSLAFVSQPLFTLRRSFVGKVLYGRPVRVKGLEIDRRGLLWVGRWPLPSLPLPWWVLGVTVVKSHE
jgi:hypothetical protein